MTFDNSDNKIKRGSKMKTKKLVIAIITIITVLSIDSYAQEIGKWRWSTAKFNATPEANTTHFLGSAFLADFMETKVGLKWWQADLTVIALGAIWEVKDAYVPYEIVPYFGAEGFSMMDLKLDIAGVVLNRLTSYGIKKIFNSTKKKTKPHNPYQYY